MNHSLNNLDDCVFDYLALNADKPVSLAKIFNDIRSKTGHRCNELTDSHNHRQYFLSTCYSLDKHYTNIKKIHRDNRLYLMFQKDRKDINFDRSYYDDPLYDDNIWKEDSNLINIVNYMCDNSMLDDFDNSYYSNFFDESNTLLHLLVKYNKYDELENLLRQKNIDPNKKNAQGETPLDLAIKSGNKKMIKLLINYWDEVPVKQLQRKPNLYKQNNQMIVTTKPDTNISRYSKHLTNTVYVLGVWYMFLNLFYVYRFFTA